MMVITIKDLLMIYFAGVLTPLGILFIWALVTMGKKNDKPT